MKLVFDTSVWIEHLRHGALDALLPALRGKYQLWMDAIVAAELLAGCSSRRERRVIEGLLEPFVRSGRVRAASSSEIEEAGRALSKLRERSVLLKNGAGGLLDAILAIGAVRVGAVLVSENVRDFERLATVTPLRFATTQQFSTLLAAQSRSRSDG